MTVALLMHGVIDGGNRRGALGEHDSAHLELI